MLQAFRYRGFALATLALFLVAQPAAWCTALCLLDRHHPPAHVHPGPAPSSGTAGASICHTNHGESVRRDPPPALSPMEPARAPVIAVAAPRLGEPSPAAPARAPARSPTPESPPPRQA